MAASAKIKDLAVLVRSKNSGPFEVTFDIIFDDPDKYEMVKRSGVINAELISRLYNVPTQNILTLVHFDVAYAIKFTIPRAQPQGGIGETDMHAAQQHAPLLDVEVPLSAAFPIGRSS
jgi:hypothetical protein